MTDSETIELLQMQLKTQQQQNEFLQKTIESLNQNIQSQTETIETLTEKIADLLSMDGMSADHLHKTIGRMFDIPLSTGTIINKLEKCAGLVSPLMDRIKEKIIQGPVAHFDETGIRVEGKTKWIHSSSNRDFTYLTLSEKRGKDGMDENGVLPDFKGIAVHDCWKAYWRYLEATHAICAVHILRELVGVIENHPHQRWAKMFRDMLHELYRLKESYADCGRTRLDTCYLDYYSLKYDEIIGIARKETPLPLQTEIKRGRKKKGKVPALIERLAQLKDSMLLFARNFEVPFTNNAAVFLIFL